MFLNPNSKKNKVFWINSEDDRNRINLDIKAFLPITSGNSSRSGLKCTVIQETKQTATVLTQQRIPAQAVKATYPSQKFNIKFVDNRNSASTTPKIELVLERTISSVVLILHLSYGEDHYPQMSRYRTSQMLMFSCKTLNQNLQVEFSPFKIFIEYLWNW